jgi:hypothetical protein
MEITSKPGEPSGVEEADVNGAIPFLDRWLNPKEAAEWLRISEGELATKHRQGKIPGAKIGHRTVRYNPRTVIERFKSKP